MTLISLFQNKKLLTFVIIPLLLFSLGWALFAPSQQPSSQTDTPQDESIPSEIPILEDQPLDPGSQPSATVSTNETEIKKLEKVLPYANSHFKAEYREQAGILEVTFFPTITGSDEDDLEKYDTQLDEYKDEFLDWLEENDVDSSKIAIVYYPDPEEN